MEVAFSVNYAHHLKQYTYSYIMYRTLCQVHTVQSQSYLKTTENTVEPAWNLSLKKIRIVQILFWCTLYTVQYLEARKYPEMEPRVLNLEARNPTTSTTGGSSICKSWKINIKALQILL